MSSVLIVYTGGTIGMVKSPSTNTLVPMDFSNIRKKVPELQMFDFKVDTITFNPPIDSSEMCPDVWVRLCNIIKDNYDSYDGFVILHGTDTMAYTASALSFMLQNLAKPVVLTGSQLPMGTIRTDGKENLIAALEIAAARENGMAIVPEVSVYFQSKLYRGNRCSKVNASDFMAFTSQGYPHLAEVGIDIKYSYAHIRYTPVEGPLSIMTDMEQNIALLKIFPGMTRGYVHQVLNIPGVRGIVMETFGSGNAPTDKWFLEELHQALLRGVVILNVTQCLAGSVEMWRYDTGRHLMDMGVISGRDITTEAALTKLMHILGNYTNPAEIRIMLNKSLKGEISFR
ncbi:MAG: asparaginase [Bacteroidales bacterium]|nr:asparaginase [Bacteroidales bacterium]